MGHTSEIKKATTHFIRYTLLVLGGPPLAFSTASICLCIVEVIVYNTEPADICPGDPVGSKLHRENFLSRVLFCTYYKIM